MWPFTSRALTAFNMYLDIRWGLATEATNAMQIAKALLAASGLQSSSFCLPLPKGELSSRFDFRLHRYLGASPNNAMNLEKVGQVVTLLAGFIHLAETRESELMEEGELVRPLAYGWPRGQNEDAWAMVEMWGCREGRQVELKVWREEVEGIAKMVEELLSGVTISVGGDVMVDGLRRWKVGLGIEQ